MFTLAGDPYPLTKLDACAVYPTGNAWCDACHGRIPYASQCFHSGQIFGTQYGGFDICATCHEHLRFRDEQKPKAKPRPAIGARVKLVNLMQMPALNLTLGRVISYPDDERRVGVQIDGRAQPVSVRADNLLMQPHFFMLEDDVLRIMTPLSSNVRIDGAIETRRAIPVEELRPTTEDGAHAIEVDGVEYMFRVKSCAICMTSSDSLKPVVGHPVFMCDRCSDIVRDEPCPFCRSTTGEHTTQPTQIPLVRLALASHDVRFFVKVASLGKRYEVLVAPTRIEIRAKYMNLPTEDVFRGGATRGGGVTRSLEDACATAVTGNGASVTLRPPANFIVDVRASYTVEMMFDKIVSFQSLLYRLSDEDATRKSREFVNGRTALERARFDLREERVALAMCVVDPSGNQYHMYVFFSVNVRMPGVVVVMPDPEGDTTEQCVSIVDFYDPQYWRSHVPAVNHNDLGAFRAVYAA